MDSLWLFTDGSVDPKSKIGYGSYLWVSDLNASLNLLKPRIQTLRFENTSSTKVELQILLYALGELKTQPPAIVVYTDCQNMLSLPERRARLELKNYTSKNNNALALGKLYRDFFTWHDKLNLELIKVKGHRPSAQKNLIDRIFTLVDRASRNGLRNQINK